MVCPLDAKMNACPYDDEPAKDQCCYRTISQFEFNECPHKDYTYTGNYKIEAASYVLGGVGAMKTVTCSKK